MCNPIVNSRRSVIICRYENSSKQKEATRKKNKNQIGLVQTKGLKKIMKE